MNRRNVLIGLGAVAVGGGAAFGSGAFSQVSADRTVNINTAGDSGGLLSLSLDTSYNGLSDNSGTDNGANNENIIQIDLEQINDSAVTTFDNALTIENNGSNTVNLSITTGSGMSGITFTLNNSQVDPNDDGSDVDQTTADIEVDTTGTVSGGTITITATDANR